MKKNVFKLLLPLICLSLTSCMGDVSELYGQNAYDSSLFINNYYQDYSQKLLDGKYKEDKNFEVNKVIKSYNELYVKLNGNYDDFNSRKSSGEQLMWNYPGTIYSDIAPQGVDTYFGATHSLAFGKNGNSAFARGYTSKLYDGRVSCSGGHALSRVQLSEKGYGTVFPLELSSYRYITLALRSATDIEGGLGTYSTIDLTVTFYVFDYTNHEYQRYNFLLNDLNLTTDNLEVPGVATSEGGSQTQMISFLFSEVSGLENNALYRASAMSMSYTLKDNSLSIPLTTNPKEEGNHYAVMLYEVLLPLSTWN
jgi:hypothetical protein